MKLNIKHLQKSVGVGHLMTAILALMVLLVPFNTFGVLNLHDHAQGLPDIDNRIGSVAPSATALNKVASLGATADWNKFGTINTMLTPGGYISTGYSGEPVAAARQWISDNRELFRLSPQGVNDLVLVSGKIPQRCAFCPVPSIRHL